MPSGLDNEFRTQHEFVKAARIRLNAVPGRAYILEGSLDLSAWSGLSTNVAAGVFLDLTDPNADINSRRYYRARRFGP